MKKSILIFYLLILITIFFIYFIKKDIVVFIFFFLLGVIAYRTKIDFFWLAFALFAYDWVGSLFFLAFSPSILFKGFQIGFIEILSIVFFLKYYNNIFGNSYLFNKPFKVYFFYIFFLLLLGFAFGMKRSDTSGEGLGGVIRVVRMIILLPLFYTVPHVLKNETNLYGFIKIVLTFSIFNIFGQFYEIINHKSIHLAFGAEYIGEAGYFEKEYIRPMSGLIMSFFNILITLFLLIKGENRYFNKKYLYIILSISIVSIFITATRGWIISIIFIFIINLIFIRKGSYKVLIVIILVSTISIQFIPKVNKQFVYAKERLLTLKDIAEGDLEAGGTTRLTTRSEAVMKKFKERPLFGWGFSAEGFMTNDAHVGNQNILMAGGIVGFIIILYMQFYILLKVFRIYNKLTGNNKKVMILLMSFLIALIFVHSSTSEFYGYLVYVNRHHLFKILFVSIFLGLIQSFILFTIRSNNIIVSKRQNNQFNKK